MGDSLILFDGQEGIQTIRTIRVEKRPEILLFNNDRVKVDEIINRTNPKTKHIILKVNMFEPENKKITEEIVENC